MRLTNYRLGKRIFIYKYQKTAKNNKSIFMNHLLVKVFPQVFTFILFSIFSITSFAQTSSFYRHIGNAVKNEAKKVTVTPDGQVYVLATTESISGKGHDIYLRKINECENVVWEKSIGSYLHETASSLDVDHMGNIYVVGSTSYDNYKQLLYITKLSAEGELIWNKAFGGRHSIKGLDIKIASNDEIYVLGQIGEQESIYLAKIDPFGDLIWAKSYGKNHKDWANSFTLMADNSVLIAGMTRSFSHTIHDINLIKIDTNGKIVWSKAFGGPHDDTAEKIIPTSDGGFAIVGHALSFHIVNPKVFLMKVTASGAYEWLKTFPSDYDEFAYDVVQDQSANYHITGHYENRETKHKTAFILSTDKEGNSLSRKVLSEEKKQTYGKSISFGKNKLYYLGSSDNAETQKSSLVFSSFSPIDKKLCVGLDTTLLAQRARPILHDTHLSSETEINYFGKTGTVDNTLLYTVEFCETKSMASAKLNLGPDTIFCKTDKIILDAGKNFEKVRWNNGTTSQFLVVFEPGIYWVEAYDGCNRVVDSIRITNCKGEIPIVEDFYSLQVGKKMAMQSLQFKQGSAELEPSAILTLDRLSRYLWDNLTIKIELSGHTDNVGNPMLNVQLSKDRVDTMKKYLISQGINGDRISVQAYGGKFPIASNDYEETRKQNRRVEIELLSK